MPFPLHVASRGLRLGAHMALAALEFGARFALAGGRLTAAERAAWLSRLCRRLLRSLGWTVECAGTPPSTGLLLPCHLSYADILVISAALPVRFVAMHEIADWPLVGWFARRAGTVFIDRRTARGVAEVNAWLASQPTDAPTTAVFLEGTTSDGKMLRPFNSALLEPACRAGIPTAAACLSYRLPGSNHDESLIVWADEQPLSEHAVRLLSVRAKVVARLEFGPPAAPVAGQRKQLARELESWVRAAREAQRTPAGHDSD